MNDEALKKEITIIVGEILEMNETEIAPEANFMDDLGLDSLRALEILAAIENKFNIIIQPELLQDMTSINKVYEITKGCIAENEK